MSNSKKNDLSEMLFQFNETKSYQILVEKISKKETEKYGIISPKKPIKKRRESYFIKKLN